MELLVKIFIDFRSQIIFVKRSILDISQVLSSLLTSISQTICTNNKRAVRVFWNGDFYYSGSILPVQSQQLKTLKTLEQDVKFV